MGQHKFTSGSTNTLRSHWRSVHAIPTAQLLQQAFAVVRELAPGAAPQGDQHLFAPKDAYRYSGGGGFQTPPDLGANPPSGVVIYYSFKTAPASDIKLRFVDGNGKLVKEFSSKETPKPADGAEDGGSCAGAK